MKTQAAGESLWSAYRGTSFEAQTPIGNVRIRVGCLEPVLDRILEHHNSSSWAFITAWNPRSQLCSLEQNLAAGDRLLREVKDQEHIAYPGQGRPDDPSWQSEESLLIIGILLEPAIMLGREFGQNAIVVGTAGTKAELVACLEEG